MPDLREPRLDQVVSAYLEAVQAQNSEPARTQRFTLLLNELFGLQTGFIEDYVSGVETYIKVRQKDVLLRGKVDALFGNVIIEFERDLTLPGKLLEAEEQLRRYVAILWSLEDPAQRTRYLCMASDGIRFRVYTPTLKTPGHPNISPDAVQLSLLEVFDAAQRHHPRELYFWLDRYLLRQEILAPRSDNIVKDFGLRSHAFQVAAESLLHLWQTLKQDSEFAVVYEAWGKYLGVVYGTAQADDELFIRHTYLAILAKLMVWLRLTESTQAPEDAVFQSVLEGQYFKNLGIENFLEEDFFSWPSREKARKTGITVARQLLGLLQNYNLRELSEDVLKSLYQELVDPQTRHDLGEFYTPDWLAARMVQKLLATQPGASLLDPACGSGTFLYQAIREKRHLLGDSQETLLHILSHVVGTDIHPLAVIVAKANYLLALGDLLQKRRTRIAIPVYLANTLQLPEEKAYIGNTTFTLELSGIEVHIPQKLLNHPMLYDQAIEAAQEFARQWAGKQPRMDIFLRYMAERHPGLAQDEDLSRQLFHIAEIFRGFIEAHRDSIWAFVMKNAYKPLFLKGRFDLVVGNPPWLSYRYVEQPKYQRFLKQLITKTYRLLTGRGNLITQMELGTLFLVRAADLYLKEGGTIAFVLPRSIFSADQHDALRRRTFQGVALRWTEVWDLEHVSPLFNVPSCVLIGHKEAGPAADAQAEDPGIPGEILTGTLPRRNADLHEAEQALQVESVRFHLNLRGKRSFWATTRSAHSAGSVYKEKFYQGATIVPRSFWFVEIEASSLGFDPHLPPVVTAQHAQKMAKAAWKGVVLRGNIEQRFLYATLLSTDLLPFGHLDFRLVVLPIEPDGDRYHLIPAEEARNRGFVHLARWLEQAQKAWEMRRGAKAEQMNVLEWLDYRRKLTGQSSTANYIVLYPASATYICATVVRNDEKTRILVDYTMYYCEIQDKSEAYYLATLLNSGITDRLIKPLQAKGLWGPRHISKKVLDLPIPKYDPTREDHRRLAELGQICAQKVKAWLASGGRGSTKSIGHLRRKVRDLLREELEEIDRIVQNILEQPGETTPD